MKQGGTPGPARVTHLSLERGLRILETVAANGGRSSLAQTSRRTGLHRSTTHHLMQTLVGLGYLHQDRSTRGYELAAKLFELTGRTWTTAQLGELATPFLKELTGQTGEGSSLAVYQDGVVTIGRMRYPDGPFRVVQDLGSTRPVHATAVGKAIAAYLPQSERDMVLSRCTFERYTRNTIETRQALETELARIRATGIALDREEHIEGIRCVAAPVFAYNGHVIASLCSLGPKSRLTQKKLRSVGGAVAAAAAELSARLGWQGDAPAAKGRRGD